jgi:hypothetical protein
MDNGTTVVKFREQLPWLRLFRAFRIAIDARKITLAALALVSLSVGNALISRLPFAPLAASREWDATLQTMQSEFGDTLPLQTIEQIDQAPWSRLWQIFGDGSLVLSPVRMVIDPAIKLFRADKDKTWSDVAYRWTLLLWALCVWSVFGGAITRLAATQFACDERISMSGALNFSVPRFLSYMSAPLLPIAGIGVFWFVCVVGGWIGLIPAVGDLIVGVLWFVALICGLLMALMLAGLAVGWPLMFAAISTEGSDGFDALSRAYSYVCNRPWYYLFLVALAIVYGSAAVFVVWLVACLVVQLSGWSVACGMGVDSVIALFQACPAFLGVNELSAGPETEPGSIAAAAAVGIWLRLVALATLGFLYSYFGTAVTIVYFLLRKSDDETDLDEVFLPREEPSVQAPAASAAAESPSTATETAPAAPESSARETGQGKESLSAAAQTPSEPSSQTSQGDAGSTAETSPAP